MSRPAPRLSLVASAAWISRAQPGLTAALRDGDVAAVLLRLPAGADRDAINAVKAVAATVQDAGAALILDGRADLVARSGADGAHLTGIAAFEEAVAGLKPDRIAGAGGLFTRHDAMTAAERGADYVMFGEPDAQGERPSAPAVIERVRWWSELFEIPCIAHAAAVDEIAPLARAGADFVALEADALTGDAELPLALGAAIRALNAAEPAP